MVDDYPDVIYGCIGGGSSFSGLMWPFYYDRVSKKAPKETQFVAVEPSACPKVTKGQYTYDHGDTAKLTPLVPMHTLGHDFMPAPIHAGGLRYHGIAPTISVLAKEKQISTLAVNQIDALTQLKFSYAAKASFHLQNQLTQLKPLLMKRCRCKKTNEAKNYPVRA